MPKKKSRKSSRLPRSLPVDMDKEDIITLSENPNTIQDPKLHNQNPQIIDDEDDLHIQNPKIVEEEQVVNKQVDDDVDLQIQNPIFIKEDDFNNKEDQSDVQNPKIINENEVNNNNTEEGDDDLQISEDLSLPIQNPNPKVIEVDSTPTKENTGNSIHGEELLNLSDKMILDEEKEKPQQSETLDGDLGHADRNDDEDEKEKKQVEEQSDGTSLSPLATSSSHDVPMPDVVSVNPVSSIVDVQETEEIAIPISPSEHNSPKRDLVLENPPPAGPKKAPTRKKILNKKQKAALEKKLQSIRKNLQPIPFVPSKTLNFSKHEKLFKSLGLWDFAHMEFDKEIRFDLLASLIVNYNSGQRSSCVNDLRIRVNRADLARALKLSPARKEKVNQPEALEMDREMLCEESISFLDEFMSNWILLHEDMWMMPDEVLTWTRYIKEGQPHRVDWPGVIWFMVEKELMQGTLLGSCYYASHLQQLIKSQRPELLIEERPIEVSLEDEDEEDNVDMRTKSMEDFQGEQMEHQHIELTLGHDMNENDQQPREDVHEDDMDLEECKGTDGPSHWLFNGKNSFNEHHLQRCNLNNVNSLDEDECQVKEEEHEEERYDFSSKGATLERISSTDLFQAIGNSNIPYSPSMQVLDNSNGDHLETRSNNNMNVAGTSSMFGNACKRELSPDEDIRHHSFNDQNKRIRSNDSWDKGSDFDVCMEQIDSWMTKAKMVHAEKEHAIMNAQMHQEILVAELQQRESFIANLQKTRYEESEKRNMEIYKRDREIQLLSNLVEDYRKALKETRRSFSEYRERYPHHEEPLYKDVPGSGGLVLSNAEYERYRLEREEEENMQRCLYEEMVKEFELKWVDKLKAIREKVDLLDEKLVGFNKEISILKESCGKRKMPEIEACIPEEEISRC